MTHHEEDNEKQFKFNPPLYIQRYFYVSQLVDQFNIKTLLDIGCAECKLIHLLKNNKNLNLIFGLDIDEQLLRNSKNILEPNSVEYVDKREQPLELSLLSGDISRPSDLFIEKLGNSQLDMISLVEVIEHMDDDSLVKCVDVVFDKLKPHYVLVTTPNSEFNVVFGDKECKFRHWDHKFEWNREEFNKWCKTVTQLYPQYEIIGISGLGMAPEKFGNVGFCTQSVVFARKKDNESNKSNKLIEYIEHLKHSNKKNIKSSYFESFNEKSSYKLIETIQYPFEYVDLENKEIRNSTFLDELNW
jgi:small RNA 2'-O-methyltransferase